MTSLEASIHASEAEVRAQQAEVVAQDVNLSLLRFNAPFAGTVLNRAPEPGNVVGPAQPPLEIADFDSIVVEVDVPEARLHLVHLGDPCEIALDAFPDHHYRGTVHEIGSRVDRARATLPVRVRFAEPYTGVLPDMSARVSFLHQAASDAQLNGAEGRCASARGCCGCATRQPGRVRDRRRRGSLQARATGRARRRRVRGIERPAGRLESRSPSARYIDGRQSREGDSALMTASSEAMVKITGLEKSFTRGNEKLTVLEGLDLEIPEGSFQALMGPSGSGKSTLLNIIAGLDRATSGSVRVAGEDMSKLNDGELASFRARNIGFIFQSYNLMPVLTAAENVELPLLLTKLPRAERRKRAHTALHVSWGLGKIASRPLPTTAFRWARATRGGHRRVPSSTTLGSSWPTSPRAISIARAPTRSCSCSPSSTKRLNKTIVMVTHDPVAAERAKVTHKLDKGALLQ